MKRDRDRTKQAGGGESPKDPGRWTKRLLTAAIALLLAACALELVIIKKLSDQNTTLDYYVNFQEQITGKLMKRCIDGP